MTVLYHICNIKTCNIEKTLIKYFEVFKIETHKLSNYVSYVEIDINNFHK